MAFIDHRCACGHRMLNHARPGDCRAIAGAGCGKPCGKRLPAPELMPSFDHQGKRVEAITPPGGMFGSTVRTCDCEQCHALHQQLTAA